MPHYGFCPSHFCFYTVGFLIQEIHRSFAENREDERRREKTKEDERRRETTTVDCKGYDMDGYSPNSTEQMLANEEDSFGYCPGPFDGLPREVRRILTDYTSSGSIGDVDPDPWWREYDVSRFDSLINSVESHPRVVEMQTAASNLRSDLTEYAEFLHSERMKVNELTCKLQEHRDEIEHVRNENVELFDQVSSMATLNVNLALQRDNLMKENIKLRERNRKITILSCSLALVLLLVGVNNYLVRKWK